MTGNFDKTKNTTSVQMSVLQKMVTRFLKRFPTAEHSGKMYIRHLFRYGQLSFENREVCNLIIFQDNYKTCTV